VAKKSKIIMIEVSAKYLWFQLVVCNWPSRGRQTVDVARQYTRNISHSKQSR